MNYEFANRADNVFVIDAKMFGFDHYMSIFLVQGKELALIDTGLPDSLEIVRAGIKAHGFSVSDISYIFVTHEHADHCGNVGPLIRENPGIKAFVHPEAGKWLIDPSLEDSMRKKNLPAKMASRFAPTEPVPPSSLNYFKDGDEFDLGNGEKLKIIFAPGHLPGGVVIFEEKNKGLFINDLVGNCFADCDFQMILNPPHSDVKLAIDNLRSIQQMSLNRLFLGHYGISETPEKIIQGAIDGMQQLLDIGAKCIAEKKPDELASRIYTHKLLEVEKLKTRGFILYDYVKNELAKAQSGIFAEYYLEKFA